MRHVNPHRRRGSAYRLYTRLLNTRVANWLSRHLIWKVDPFLMRISGGRIGFGVGLPTALLETRGARSGQLRRNGVIYFNDGDDVIVIASKLGLPDHPTWFHNLCAHPDVVLGGDPFRAEVVADDAERTRLWALADNVFPPYAAYRARTQRTIPIVRLVPR
jgi:deazaflavin-dependent oxidoreductase (nitroreductase family)